MNKNSLQMILVLFIVFPQTVFGEDWKITEVDSGETYDFSEQKILEIGKYRIIEYPETPRRSIELQINKKPLYVKDGASSSIFHQKLNVPVVMLDDTDNDGSPDRLSYDVYDKNGKFISSSTDLNFDGQIDLRIDAEAKKSYVWINDKWYSLKELDRDSSGKVIRKINVKGKWKKISIKNYPFIIEK